MGHVFKQVCKGINVAPMIAALYENPFLWDQITARQETPGSPHSETKTIFLRWSQSQSIEAAFHEVEAVDYPALKDFPEAADLINEFVRLMKPTKLGRVIITSLRPDGFIEPHVDEGAYPDAYQRFHIPIVSAEGNLFFGDVDYSQSEFVRMRSGELWWFDNKRRHWVFNKSNTPRVHIIFDAIVPGWERSYDLRARSL